MLYYVDANEERLRGPFSNLTALAGSVKDLNFKGDVLMFDESTYHIYRYARIAVFDGKVTWIH